MGAQAGDYQDHQRQAPFLPSPDFGQSDHRQRFGGGRLHEQSVREPATSGRPSNRHPDGYVGRAQSLPPPFRQGSPFTHSHSNEGGYDDSYDPYTEHPAYPSVATGSQLRMSSSLGRVPRFDSSSSTSMRHAPPVRQDSHWSIASQRPREGSLRAEATAMGPHPRGGGSRGCEATGRHRQVCGRLLQLRRQGARHPSQGQVQSVLQRVQPLRLSSRS